MAPRPFRLNGGRRLPQDAVSPISCRPVAVNLARFQRWIFPDPALVAVLPAQVASRTTCTASVNAVWAGHMPPIMPPVPPTVPPVPPTVPPVPVALPPVPVVLLPPVQIGRAS